MVHRNHSFPSFSEKTHSHRSLRTKSKMPRSPKNKDGPEKASPTVSDGPVVMHHHKHNLKHRFEVLKTLGEGTYGKVKLAVDRNTGEQVAIKYIRKNKILTDQDLIRIQREIKIMASLRHPHIVNITEVFENKEKIILVMEYAAGGELYDYINEKKVLHESEARKFFRQIVSAIHHCHQNGVVHRDLKLENIVLDGNGNIKIADFGLSNHYSYESLLSTYCGSPLYASPEIVNGTPYHGPEIDCWSLGVLLYTLVYGAMPFDGSDFKRLRRQITEGDFFEPSRPSDASGLIKNLLHIDPKKRATIEHISQHWWVNVGYNYPAVQEGLKFPPLQPPVVYSSFHSHSSDSDESETPNQPPVTKRSQKAGTREQSKSKSSSSSKGDKDDKQETVPKEKNVDNPQSPNGEAKSPIAFDSRKKPKRGILKNHNKSNDSGCVLEEHSSSEKQDTFDLTDIDTVLENAHSSSPPNETCDKSNSDTRSSSSTSLLTTSADSTTSLSAAGVGETTEIDANGKTSTVVRRRGILKKRGRYSGDFDATNRYSCGSISSNSSGDILDFSYDSMDGEHIFSYSFSADIDNIDGKKAIRTPSPTIVNIDISNEMEINKGMDMSGPFFGVEETRDLYRQALDICT